MATATVQPQMESMTISFPKMDLKRLKGIAKAMGWTLEKPEPKVLGELTDEECWKYLSETRPDGFVLLNEEEEAGFEKWMSEQ